MNTLFVGLEIKFSTSNTKKYVFNNTNDLRYYIYVHFFSNISNVLHLSHTPNRAVARTVIISRAYHITEGGLCRKNALTFYISTYLAPMNQGRGAYQFWGACHQVILNIPVHYSLIIPQRILAVT